MFPPYPLVAFKSEQRPKECAEVEGTFSSPVRCAVGGLKKTGQKMEAAISFRYEKTPTTYPYYASYVYFRGIIPNISLSESSS